MSQNNIVISIRTRHNRMSLEVSRCSDMSQIKIIAFLIQMKHLVSSNGGFYRNLYFLHPMKWYCLRCLWNDIPYPIIIPTYSASMNGLTMQRRNRNIKVHTWHIKYNYNWRPPKILTSLLIATYKIILPRITCIARCMQTVCSIHIHSVCRLS